MKNEFVTTLAKIIVYGDRNVGKTTFIHRIMGFDAQKINKSAKISFYIKGFTLEDESICITIWDFLSERDVMYMFDLSRSATAVFICYDVTRRETFENIEEWVNNVRKYTKCPIILIGNKSDLEPHAVTEEEAIKKAEDLGCMGNVMVSALNGNNIDNAITLAAKKSIEYIESFR